MENNTQNITEIKIVTKISMHILILFWLWMLIWIYLENILTDNFIWLRGSSISISFLIWILYIIRATWFKYIKLNHAIYISYFIFLFNLAFDFINLI